MVFDVTMVIVLELYELRPNKTVNLIDNHVCLTAPPSGHSLISSGPSSSRRHYNIEMWPINNPTVASKCSSESKNRKFLAFNQKLAIIKFSREGIS